jgi:hypothetical protein
VEASKDQIPPAVRHVRTFLPRPSAGAVVRLTEVFRQAAKSRIIVNAHRINHGLMLDLAPTESGDFYFVRPAYRRSPLTADSAAACAKLCGPAHAPRVGDRCFGVGRSLLISFAPVSRVIGRRPPSNGATYLPTETARVPNQWDLPIWSGGRYTTDL